MERIELLEDKIEVLNVKCRALAGYLNKADETLDVKKVQKELLEKIQERDALKQELLALKQTTAKEICGG